MIRLYFSPAPNPLKVVLLLEEIGLDYELIPVDTRKGEQHSATFRNINPNGKVPAIVDLTTADSEPRVVFDSTAILLYLADKTGKLLGEAPDHGQLLSWLMFIATGLGPYSGQAVHFQRMAPEASAYAVNRYRREAERHYAVLDERLTGRDHIVGADLTIADISAWGWIARAEFVLPGVDAPLDPYPNIERWFERIESRPATKRAKEAGSHLSFKQEMDEEAKRALFPSNY